MEQGKPSRTAWSVACRRAGHSLFDTPPLVFDDPIALRILGAGAEAKLLEDRLRHDGVFGRAMRAFLIMRSRYAEDRLHEAVAAGIRQYLVLGAGLDTFAYRNPYAPGQLQVFEVDHPDTQAWKRRLLAENGVAIPASVHFVPVDFEQQELSAALAAGGFNLHAPACISWLGVTQYLTLEAFRATIRVLGTLPSGTALTLEYALDRELLSPHVRDAVEAIASQVDKLGEPFRLTMTPEVVEAELREAGFYRIRQMLPGELNDRYFHQRADGLCLMGEASRMLTAWV